MPNPYRLTVQWILGPELFPQCFAHVGKEPPRKDASLLSRWYLPADSLTSEGLAAALDRIREDVKVAYAADQLRALANQIRNKKPKLENFIGTDKPVGQPWNKDIDPWGEDGYVFYGSYLGKNGPEQLLAWVAEIRVEG